MFACTVLAGVSLGFAGGGSCVEFCNQPSYGVWHSPRKPGRADGLMHLGTALRQGGGACIKNRGTSVVRGVHGDATKEGAEQQRLPSPQIMYCLVSSYYLTISVLGNKTQGAAVVQRLCAIMVGTSLQSGFQLPL